MRTYTIYIDQSGKVEDMSMDTGIAFSQEGAKEDTFYETAVIRKEHKNRLKPLAKNSLGSVEKYRLKLFACGIFVITQDYIDAIEEIVIDKEWQGKESQIKSYLYNFYQNNLGIEVSEFPDIRVEEVHQLIEGNPKCDELAYDAREENINPGYISDYSFLKGMVLTSPGNGRNT